MYNYQIELEKLKTNQNDTNYKEQGNFKTIVSNVFETSDGKKFLDKDEAREHQCYLNKPKVYIIEEHGFISFASLSESKAQEYYKKNNSAYASLRTIILD